MLATNLVVDLLRRIVELDQLLKVVADLVKLLRLLPSIKGAGYVDFRSRVLPKEGQVLSACVSRGIPRCGKKQRLGFSVDEMRMLEGCQTRPARCRFRLWREV